MAYSRSSVSTRLGLSAPRRRLGERDWYTLIARPGAGPAETVRRRPGDKLLLARTVVPARIADAIIVPTRSSFADHRRWLGRGRVRKPGIGRHWAGQAAVQIEHRDLYKHAIRAVGAEKKTRSPRNPRGYRAGAWLLRVDWRRRQRQFPHHPRCRGHPRPPAEAVRFHLPGRDWISR